MCCAVSLHVVYTISPLVFYAISLHVFYIISLYMLYAVSLYVFYAVAFMICKLSASRCFMLPAPRWSTVIFLGLRYQLLTFTLSALWLYTISL